MSVRVARSSLLLYWSPTLDLPLQINVNNINFGTLSSALFAQSIYYIAT